MTTYYCTVNTDEDLIRIINEDNIQKGDIVHCNQGHPTKWSICVVVTNNLDKKSFNVLDNFNIHWKELIDSLHKLNLQIIEQKIKLSHDVPDNDLVKLCESFIIASELLSTQSKISNIRNELDQMEILAKYAIQKNISL